MTRESLDVDSTQTLRAIDPSELYDSQQPRWYAIQLVLSDRPVNLDMMPRLEVFAEHRLYTITAKQADGTWHALRLGFFPDEQSAEGIRGYLQTFFASPSIVRVSEAEQTRFVRPAAPRAAAPKPAATHVPAPAAPQPALAQTPVAAQTAVKTATAKTSAVKTAPAKATAAKAQSSTRRSKTLGEELVEEAREVQRARSGKKQAPEQSGSWLARLLGGAKPRPRSV